MRATKGSNKERYAGHNRGVVSQLARAERCYRPADIRGRRIADEQPS